MRTCTGRLPGRLLRCSCAHGPSRYNRGPLPLPQEPAMSFAFVFPGQGSQSVGMLADFAQEAVVRDAFSEAATALGYDLWALTQEGPAERLNTTEYTQPAMLTAGVALWRLWKARGGADPG